MLTEHTHWLTPRDVASMTGDGYLAWHHLTSTLEPADVTV